MGLVHLASCTRPILYFYKSSFKSFSPIHPFFLKGMAMTQVSTAGSTKQIRIMPIQSMGVIAALAPLAISCTQPVYTPKP